MQIAQRLSANTRAGPTVLRDGTSITPLARAITLRLPFAALVWNRPAAVVVDDGQSSCRIPIRDVTRLAQWGLMLLGSVFAVAMAIVMSEKRR